MQQGLTREAAAPTHPREVALFITCLGDTLFPETGHAVVQLLERLGVEVRFPRAQTCCGQMHLNTGYTRETLPLVDRLGVEDVGAYFPHRVTYHPTCHGLRMLGLGDRPLRLLRAVRGIEVVQLPEAEQCCGFGGTFAVKNAEVSTAMLTEKVRSVLDTRAEVCVAGDSSCLMHIGGALSRQRSGVRTMHLAEVLACTEAS